MSPTFLRGKDQVAVLGTPGGSRIISMVLLGILHLTEGADAQQASAAPRIHHQYLPDVLRVEPDALDAQALDGLRARGHQIEVASQPWGNMHVARWDLRDGSVDAGADPRGVGVGRTSDSEDRGAIFR